MWIFGRTGESGFSARSTAEQVTHGLDGTGLTAIVTGIFLTYMYVYVLLIIKDLDPLFVLCFY